MLVLVVPVTFAQDWHGVPDKYCERELGTNKDPTSRSCATEPVRSGNRVKVVFRISYGTLYLLGQHMKGVPATEYRNIISAFARTVGRSGVLVFTFGDVLGEDWSQVCEVFFLTEWSARLETAQVFPIRPSSCFDMIVRLSTAAGLTLSSREVDREFLVGLFSGRAYDDLPTVFVPRDSPADNLRVLLGKHQLSKKIIVGKPARAVLAKQVSCSSEQVTATATKTRRAQAIVLAIEHWQQQVRLNLGAKWADWEMAQRAEPECELVPTGVRCVAAGVPCSAGALSHDDK